MKIIDDNEFSEFILNTIRENYKNKEPRAGKWHVSDILYPRYAVLNRRDPHEITDTEIGFFFMGESVHKFIQGLLGDKDAEVSGEVYNITSHADYFNGATLVEFKTSRKWTVPEQPEEIYIEQGAMYCVIYDVKKVKITVIYPTAGRKWNGQTASTVEVKSWEVEFDDADLASVAAQMLSLRDQMDVALRTGDVKGLPPCPDFKYGSVEYDSEKKEYWMKIRCPFAIAGLCKCGTKLYEELDYKNAHRRKTK